MKTMLQLHWEKFVLGLVVLGLPAMLGLGTRIPDLTVIEEIEKVKGSVSKIIEDPPSISASPIHAQVEPGSQSPSFAGSFRTKFIGVVNIVKGMKGPRVAPAAARLGKPAVAPEGISLVIVADSPATRFIIERRSATEEWAVIGRTTKDPAFFDGTVVPKVEYSYRVKPDSGEPAAYSDIVTAIAADIWTITFENPTEAGRRVWVTIQKYDREAGHVSINHLHAEGETIGTWSEGTGTPTSKHRVESKKLGRMVMADFDTTCVLEKMTFNKKIDYTYELCEKTVACPGKKTLQGSTFVTEIIYRNDAKKAVEVRMGGFRQTGWLCADHGDVDEIKKRKAEIEDKVKTDPK